MSLQNSQKNDRKYLRLQDISQGMRLKRIEGEDGKEADVGRVGIVQPSGTYNACSSTFTILYPKTNRLPTKTDDACSPFEFEIVQDSNNSN